LTDPPTDGFAVSAVGQTRPATAGKLWRARTVKVFCLKDTMQSAIRESRIWWRYALPLQRFNAL